MVVMNGLDRFHLLADVVERVPKLRHRAAYLKQLVRDKLIDHKRYIREHGEDMPEIRDWRGPADSGRIPGRIPGRTVTWMYYSGNVPPLSSASTGRWGGAWHVR
ncbi:hypothetical protein JCM17961_31500 [Endothiovibrio diazotrophicus]